MYNEKINGYEKTSCHYYNGEIKIFHDYGVNLMNKQAPGIEPVTYCILEEDYPSATG